MRRTVLAALVALVLASAPLVAQTPILTVDLSTLGLSGPVTAVVPIELDAAPGSEFIIHFGGPFANTWVAVYPQAMYGLCVSPVFALSNTDRFVDINADGRQEIQRFDDMSQTVTFMTVPGC